MRTLLVLSLAASYALTCFAESSSAVDPRILLCVRVPVLAGDLSGERASVYVDFVGDRFQVLRIDTMPDTAFMIDLHPFRNGSISNHVGNYVGTTNPALMESPTVAFLADVSCPMPAPLCFGHLLPEGVIQPERRSILVVATPATMLGLTIAWLKYFPTDGALLLWNYSRSSGFAFGVCTDFGTEHSDAAREIISRKPFAAGRASLMDERHVSSPCDFRLGLRGIDLGVVDVQDGFDGRLYPQNTLPQQRVDI